MDSVEVEPQLANLRMHCWFLPIRFLTQWPKTRPKTISATPVRDSVPNMLCAQHFGWCITRQKIQRRVDSCASKQKMLELDKRCNDASVALTFIVCCCSDNIRKNTTDIWVLFKISDVRTDRNPTNLEGNWFVSSVLQQLRNCYKNFK